MKKWIKDHQHRLALAGLFLGLAVIGIFPLSEYVDAWRRSQIVETVTQQATDAGEQDREQWLLQAQSFNAMLAGQKPALDPAEILPYEQQLDLQHDGSAFSYVTIPKIALQMPVFHGTGDEVLSAGAGHIKGTSLPVGGSYTHTVVSAHSGMARMRAFDDLRKLEKGDLFGFKTLGENYVYEVDQIETVEPDAVDRLKIHSADDRATLVTCTPYGINSQRLLVSGHRIETPADWDQQDTPATVSQIAGNSRVAPFLIAAVFVIFVIGITQKKARAESRRRKDIA